MEEIIAYQSWEEVDGEWENSGWADCLDYPIDDDYELIEILDTDKHGRPTKAIFRPNRTS